MSDADTALLEPTDASSAEPPADAGADAPDAPPAAIAARLVVSMWLSDAARSRLVAAGGFQVIDDLERAADAEIIVVSTRIPPGQSPARVAELRSQVGCPIVAVVHPGGEDQAVALMSAGALGLIAEGNEPTIGAFLGADLAGSGLLDAFEQTLDRRSSSGRRSTGDRDPITRLRGLAALDARLSGGGAGAVPRLGWARIVGLEDSTRRLSHEARDLLRRRIANQFEETSRYRNTDVFSAGIEEFALVTDTLSIVDFEQLGRDLMITTAGFSPDRSTQLTLAFGHAGPEATSSLDTLRELAIRGMQLSAENPDQGVIGADRLALTLASGTELETAFRAIRTVESRDAYPDGHGERVARYATAIAEQLDLKELAVLQVRLAAHLHDIGKLTLSEDAAAGTEDSLTGADLDEYKHHSTRGGDLLRAAAGQAIAEAVHRHHERWDGSGYPDGLTGEAIPLSARIIAVADALDRWSTTGGAPDLPTSAAIQKAVEQGELMFDPAVVEAAAAAFAQ